MIHILHFYLSIHLTHLLGIKNKLKKLNEYNPDHIGRQS